MPFHPTFFELFARASRLRFGHVNTDNLGKWQKLENAHRMYEEVPRHPAAQRGQAQWWLHHNEDGRLAPNPILVPLLPPLLLSANRTSLKPSSNDPFTSLPRRLSDAVVELSDPMNIASLRSASCAEHLLLSSWHRALTKPWFWGLWNGIEPSFWPTTFLPALFKERFKRDEARQHFEEQAAVVREVWPDIADAWCEEHAPLEEFYATVSPVELPLLAELSVDKKTNWCRIYYEIKTHWDALKRLQNKDRIWRDLQEILQSTVGVALE